MRKRDVPEVQRGLAPLTIGLGPNFLAGGNVDVGIERHWDDLGRVIREGSTHEVVRRARTALANDLDASLTAFSPWWMTFLVECPDRS
jgi:xanthine dehydrogenase accessory factor